MTIYLYKKTHNKTGLQYLGKTSEDPIKYKGSGKDWLPHIKEHGNDVTTEIIKECHSKEELNYWGRYYSQLWNIVDSDKWANKIPETGGGGGLGGLSSETASKINKERVLNGTHNLLGGKQQKTSASKLLAERKHPLQRRADGTSHATDRVARGSHHFLGAAQTKKQIASGTHSSCIKKTCEHCGKTVSTNMYSVWHGKKCKKNK
jgi:hypothetical protein